MTQVVLKGTPACAWQIDGKDKNGGTVLDLTDKEIEVAKKNELIEYYVDKKVQEKIPKDLFSDRFKYLFVASSVPLPI